jgi:2-haloacid dehalogenase
MVDGRRAGLSPVELSFMTTLDFGRFEVLTFDCYGTLIDWEAGIARGLRAALGRVATASDEALLELYARREAELEAGPYVQYREILARACAAVGQAYGIEATDDALRRFAGSVGEWLAFPDSAEALARLATRFRLGVLTNCDDDLFALSEARLGVHFEWVVTAQQVRSYKPNPRHFQVAFERIDVPRDRILHVAQSLYHDHIPAKRFGLSTVWIDRRHDQPGSGATPPATATPDLTAPDMATFAELALT